MNRLTAERKIIEFIDDWLEKYSELLRTPCMRSSDQGYAFVSSRRPAPSSFSMTLNSKASTFLCYLTIDLRTLPQVGPRNLWPQPKRTF